MGIKNPRGLSKYAYKIKIIVAIKSFTKVPNTGHSGSRSGRKIRKRAHIMAKQETSIGKVLGPTGSEKKGISS